MSRFSRASRVSPRLLYRRLLRRAWLCFWLTWLALGVGAYLLTLRVLPQEPESQGMVGYWVARADASPQSERLPLPLHVPEPEPAWEMPQLPDYAVSPQQVELVDMPEVESDTAPPLLEVPEAIPLYEGAPSPRRASRPAHKVAAQSVAAQPPAASQSSAAEGDYTPPAYRRAPKPPYPTAMRQSRLEGSVRLRINIDAEGVPQKVEVIASSGHVEFDSTAIAWVLRNWLFAPARRGGHAVPGLVVTSVRFVLQ